MKSFTAEGVEKRENSDILLEIQESSNELRRVGNFVREITTQLAISNMHFTIINDTNIEEPA